MEELEVGPYMAGNVGGAWIGQSKYLPADSIVQSFIIWSGDGETDFEFPVVRFSSMN